MREEEPREEGGGGAKVGRMAWQDSGAVLEAENPGRWTLDAAWVEVL